MNPIRTLQKSFFHLLLFVSLGLFLTHCSENSPQLKNGFYRFAIDRPDGNQIIFNAEAKDSAGKKIMYIINADDKLLVDDITVKEDSLLIRLPFFDSEFMTRPDAAGNLSGQWIKDFGKRTQYLPFTATYNDQTRFAITQPATKNFTGRWAVTFTREDGRTSQSVGEFKQEGPRLTGTFLNPSGDYRFLEGVVSRDSMYLSGFDGGMVLLVKAKLDSNNTITDGKLYSGEKSVVSWSARQDENAALPDEYTLTNLKPGATRLDFVFPDMDGKLVSIDDARFRNKVVVVQIMGSWCPNCMDEAQFVMQNYAKYKERGLEFIGLAYERTTDFQTSKRALMPFVTKFDIQYPILITGVTVDDTLLTEKTLPQLDKIRAFPTTIFIDKRGEVRRIHAGFNGPATGIHFENYKKEFEELTNKLLSE